MPLIIKLKIMYEITSESTQHIKTEQTIKNGGKRERERKRVSGLSLGLRLGLRFVANVKKTN